MKRKLMTMLAGGLILITPFIAKAGWAQSAANAPFPIMNGVELSQQQEAQLQQVRLQTRAQIEQILTPEQRNQFKASLERGEGIQKAIAAMNLSTEQKSQLQTVFRSAREQFGNTLTPEQKQQIRSNVRSTIMQRR